MSRTLQPILSRFGNRPPANRAFRPTGLLRPPPIETLSVDRAATRVARILREYADRFLERHREIVAQRADRKRADRPDHRPRTPRPDRLELRPMAVQVTTGTGKTAAIRRLLPLAITQDLGVAIICRDHSQIDAYETALPELLHYHGRSAEDPSARIEKQNPWTCWKYGLVTQVSEAHHLPQPSICRFHCEHGMKRALNRLSDEISDSQENEKREDIKKWFRAHRIPDTELDKIKPCLWLDHQEDARLSQVIGLPAQSFSKAMSIWQRGTDTVERLVIIDESVPLAEPISVSLAHVSSWREAAAAALGELRRNVLSPDLDDREQQRLAAETEGMRIAVEMCEALAEYLGQATASGGTRPVPEWLRDRMKAIKDKTRGTWQGGTAPWERLGWEGLAPKSVPYRAASAILHTVCHGGGHVADGQLHVVALTQVGEWVCDGKPCILLDATLPVETRAVVEAVGGRVAEIHVSQNLIVKRYPNTLFGRGHSNKNSDKQKDYIDRSTRRVCAIGNRIVDDPKIPRAIITHKPWRDMIEEDKILSEELTSSNAVIGHFGLDDRAHDNWSGRHLAIVGGPNLSHAGWRSEYSTARLIALRAGADASDWPAWPHDPDTMERVVWIDEGAGHEVRCRAPLPRDPAIRAWVLARYRETIVQAIGRMRAVRHRGAPLIVEMWGGLPVDLSSFGISAVTYHDSPFPGTADRNRQAHAEADRRFDKALEAVLSRGLKPSRPLIETEMRRLGIPVMSPRLIYARLRAHQETSFAGVPLGRHRAPTPDPAP